MDMGAEDPPMWCWTGEVNENVVIPTEFGAHKWGYVESEVDEMTGTFQSEYEVTVFSAQSEYGQLDGSMFIIMIGDISISEEAEITNHGILKGQRLKAKFKSGIIGNPQVLQVRTTNTKKYLCKKIQIKLQYKIWEFPCSDYLRKGKTDKGVSFGLSKRIGYTLDLKVVKACDDPTWIQVYGDKGKTQKILITDIGFQAGSNNVNFLGDYVGLIFKVVISKGNVSKPLGLEFVSIYYNGDDGNKVRWGNTEYVYKSSMWTKEKPKKKRKKPAAPKPTKAAPTDVDSPANRISNALSTVDQAQAQKSFSGACLNEENFLSILDIQCNTTFELLESDFEEDFKILNGAAFPNLKHIYVRCPENCLKDQPVVGLTIHTMDTKICAAAIADRALDHVGGVISLTMTKAQKTYDYQFLKPNGVNIKKVEFSDNDTFVSPVSFVIAKVDSPAMVDSNVRVIKEGKISIIGRLELKMSEKWVTVAKDGDANTNRLNAKAACTYLGYVYGMPVDGTDPPLGNTVGQIKLRCDGTKNFACNQEEVTSVSHNNDLIVQCMNIDPTDPNKEDGTYLLSKTVFGEAGKGNYPVIYYGNVAHVLCSPVFEKPANDQSEDNSKANADSFCRAMGYPGAANEEFAKIDKKIDRKVAIAKKDSVKFILSLPELDTETGKYKKVDPVSIKPVCPISEIKCEGIGSGGASAAGDQKPMTRAKYPPVKNIKCDNTLDENDLKEYTAGDPGSVFTFKCEKECKGQGPSLKGAGLYHAGSSICNAAIQQSMFSSSEGGFASIVIGYPTKYLVSGETADEIVSESFGTGSQEDVKAFTFAVVPTNTCYNIPPPSPSSFIQTGDNVSRLTQMFAYPKRFNRVNTFKSRTNHQESSLIQMNTNIKSQSDNLGMVAKNLSFLSPYFKYYQTYFNYKVPIFWWIPPEAQSLNLEDGSEDNIDLSEVNNASHMRELGEIWTILIGFTFDELWPEMQKVIILDVGGDGCYQFAVENLWSEKKPTDFEFHKKGKTGAGDNFYSKFTPVKDRNYHIAIVFQKIAETSNLIFYVNGEEVATAEKLEFDEFTCEPDAPVLLGNGDENFPFIGSFKYLILFKTALTKEDIDAFMANVDDRIIMPDVTASYSGVVTSDGRPCITSPISLPTPGQPGSPPGPNYEGSFKEKTEYSPSSGMDEDQPSELEGTAAEDFGSAIANCLYKGSSAWGPDGNGYIKTKPGNFSHTAKKIRCPANCKKATNDAMPLIGPKIAEGDMDVHANFIYSIDSSICASAIHAGIITEQEGGNIIYHLSQGTQGFVSSEQNGFKSTSGDKSSSSVFIKPGPEPIVLNCAEAAKSQLKEETGARYGIECPNNCYSQFRTMSHNVWGNPLIGYTTDSSVCLAAMHADLLADNEANYVIIEMFKLEKPMKFKCKFIITGLFVPCQHRGITAQTKSYSFGFKFVDTLLSCKYFIIKKGKMAFMDQVKQIKGKGDWSEADHPTLGLIITPPSDPAPNIVIMKNFDCSNVKFTVNLRIIEFHPDNMDDYFGIIFRYLKIDSVEEYYMIKIMKSKMEFVKVTDGNEDVINTNETNDSQFGVISETHLGLYSIDVQYLINKIDVRMQIDNQIVKKDMLKEDNYDIHRGKVGLAKKGDVKLNVSLVKTAPPVFEKGPSTFDPNSIVGTWLFEFAAVESYCNTKYRFVTETIPGYCKTAAGFCSLKTLESNIANDMSKSDQVKLLCDQRFKLTRQLEEENRRRQGFNPCEFAITAGEEKVPFIDGMKIDYLPDKDCEGNDNADTYVPAWIYSKSIETVNGEKICAFNIAYACDLNLNTQSFTYPFVKVEKMTDRAKIFKCGNQIPSRLPPYTANPAINFTPAHCTGVLTELTAAKYGIAMEKKLFIAKLMCC